MKLVKGASVPPELSMREKVLTVAITVGLGVGFFFFGMFISWAIWDAMRRV